MIRCKVRPDSATINQQLKMEAQLVVRGRIGPGPGQFGRWRVENSSVWEGDCRCQWWYRNRESAAEAHSRVAGFIQSFDLPSESPIWQWSKHQRTNFHGANSPMGRPVLTDYREVIAIDSTFDICCWLPAQKWLAYTQNGTVCGAQQAERFGRGCVGSRSVLLHSGGGEQEKDACYCGGKTGLCCSLNYQDPPRISILQQGPAYHSMVGC